MASEEHLVDTYKGVQSEFTSLETDNSVADTVFRVGNEGNTKDFHVVGALFAIRSPYFKGLLFGRLREAQPSMDIEVDNAQSTLSTENLVSHPKKFVRLPDISPGAFKFLKSLFYSTQPSLNKSIVSSVTYASKKYLLARLHKSCLQFIACLLPNDSPGFIEILVELRNYGLKDESQALLEGSEKYWSLLITSRQFRLLPFIMVKAILRNNKLTLTEEIIWDNCLKWAKYQFERDNSMEEALDINKEPLETKESSVHFIHALPCGQRTRNKKNAPYRTARRHRTFARKPSPTRTQVARELHNSHHQHYHYDIHKNRKRPKETLKPRREG